LPKKYLRVKKKIYICEIGQSLDYTTLKNYLTPKILLKSVSKLFKIIGILLSQISLAASKHFFASRFNCGSTDAFQSTAKEVLLIPFSINV
jgi:hypothetical protein